VCTMGQIVWPVGQIVWPVGHIVWPVGHIVGAADRAVCAGARAVPFPSSSSGYGDSIVILRVCCHVAGGGRRGDRGFVYRYAPRYAG
jgi:hypothetical protein